MWVVWRFNLWLISLMELKRKYHQIVHLFEQDSYLRFQKENAIIFFWIVSSFDGMSYVRDGYTVHHI